jgi:hypothetical protein
VYTNCCQASQSDGSLAPEQAGEPVKNWLLSCSENALAVSEPVPPG